MKQVINPYRELSAEINPQEFEKFCMETLNAYAEREGLLNFEIEHNHKIETSDGTYQIDVFAKYTALGCENTVLVECKKYSQKIERAKVAELYAKLQSIGAQKGILIATSGFQSGAVEFAKAHGIALWQICDRYIKHITASANPKMPLILLIQSEIEKYLPDYIMMEWDCNADYPYKELYPTKKMYDDAFMIVRELHQIQSDL